MIREADVNTVPYVLSLLMSGPARGASTSARGKTHDVIAQI